MINFFLLFFIGLNALAMDPPGAEPKLPVDAKKVSQLYRELAIEKTVAKRLKIPAGREFGDAIAPSEFDESYFRIETRTIPKLPIEAQRIYRFLNANEFFREMGTINVQRMLNENVSALSKIKMDILTSGQQVTSTTSMNILRHKGGQKKVFHELSTGIFFRKDSSIDRINPALQWLFEPKEELASLFKEIEKIHDEIIARQIQLITVIGQNGVLPGAILDQLINHPMTPPLLARSLENNRPNLVTVQDFAKLIKGLRLLADEELQNMQDRKKALQYIVPAPIDIALLYSFYLFEDSRKFLFDTNETYVDFTNSFAALDGLSVMEILSPHAITVFESLGFRNSKTPVVDVKPSKKKAKNSKKNIPPKPKAAIKIVSEMKNDLEEAAAQAIALPANEAALSGEIAVASNTEMALPTKMIKGGRWLSSLKDIDSPKNIQLRHLKGHRLLDTFARLVAHELAWNKFPAGSLSIAMVSTQKRDRDELIISTQRDISEAQVKKAVAGALLRAKKLALRTPDLQIFIKEQKSKIYEIKEQPESIEGFKEQSRLRTNLDLIKLIVALRGDHGDEITKRFKRILENSQSAVCVIDNPFRFHSEIRMINRLKEIKSPLDFTDGQPYQYIGGSINSCGKCTALIKGDEKLVGYNTKADETNMAFFVRGHYHIGYPNYVVPRWARLINHLQENEVTRRLNEITVPIKDIAPLGIWIPQEADLSESEEDF